jgi:lipopolysaccharide transport system ATP-binding protein
MTDIAIHAEGIAKQYLIGSSRIRNDTLRDQIVDSVKSVFRRKDPEAGAQKKFWALRDVSFSIRRGEIVGIIGHNGAGKSTLLKVLSRITEPTSGSGEIYGRVGSLLEVGTGFHPELTGRENIYLNGAIIGMRREEIRRYFDAIVDFAEVDKFIDTPVKRYSSGMYVRLAFAVSAHLKPEILMVDEVLSVGDLQFQQKCMAYAEELRKSGATVLFVSHNMFSVKAVCNRVLWLAGGEVRADGKPDEVIARYEQSSRCNVQEFDPARNAGEKPVVRITYVETLNGDGNERTVFEHGERMKVRVGYVASEEVPAPNFVVAFIRSDNVECCNYSTSTDGFEIGSLSGEGTIEVVTPPLKLISESYAIHILVWDTLFRKMHCWFKGPNFHVRHHLYSTHFGVFHEEGEWLMPEQLPGTDKYTGGSQQ